MSPDAPADPDLESYPYWRRNMRSLSVGVFCNTMGFTVSFPYLALIVKDMGAQGSLATWVGLLAGGFFTVSFLLQPVWGSFADYFGRKSMVLRAGLGMFIGFGALGLVHSMVWFLPLFVLAGTCNGYVPSAVALVATNTPRRSLGKALSTVQSAQLLGTACGPVLGAWLAETLPATRELFWVSSVLSGLAGTVALLFARERAERPDTRFRLTLLQDTARILRVPSMWVLFLVSFLFASAMFGSTAVVALYVLELVHGARVIDGLGLETWVGVATMALTISSAAAAPLWGRWLDRFEPGRVLAFSLLAGMLASWLMVLVQNPLQLTLARVVLGVCAVGIQPAAVHLIKTGSPPGMDARSLALGTALSMLGNGAAPFAAGIIGPLLGLRAHFGFIALLLCLGLVLWVLRGMGRVRAVPS